MSYELGLVEEVLVLLNFFESKYGYFFLGGGEASRLDKGVCPAISYGFCYALYKGGF